MCGRYDKLVSFETFRDNLKVDKSFVDDLRELNLPEISPGTDVGVVLLDAEKKRVHVALRWGLVPAWEKDEKVSWSNINARVETVATKPAFRSAFQKRRCLVPATGFHEWTPRGKVPKGVVKTRWRIHMKEDALFCMAGIYEHWEKPDGTFLRTFSILTGPANDAMKAVHDRMPCILRPENYADWLDNKIPGEALRPSLEPYPADEMEVYKTNRVLNLERNGWPVCEESMVEESGES